MKNPNKNKKSILEKSGAIIGLIGGLLGLIGGGLAIYDRLSEPNLKVLGILPIAVWERIDKDIDKSIWGISFIARVRNTGNKPSYILG